MKALVCGRGESLSAYKDYKTVKLDYIYLVNEFNKFVFQDYDLKDFLNAKSKQGTKIIQIVNIEMAGLDKNFVDNIKIDEVFCTRMNYTNESHWWRDYFNQDRFINSLGIKVKPQPECLEPYMNKVGNSLPVAILNAVLDKKCNEVDIIGSDFYESFYYLDNKDEWSSSQWSNENTKKTQERLKRQFNDVINCFQNVNFAIKTQSTFISQHQNCKVEYRQKEN